MNCVDVGHDEYADNSSENALYCFSKETAPCKHVEEVNQLFQKNPKKKSAKIEDKKDLVLPTLKECVAEAEVLYQYSNLDPEFRKFEMQYKARFRCVCCWDCRAIIISISDSRACSFSSSVSSMIGSVGFASTG